MSTPGAIDQESVTGTKLGPDSDAFVTEKTTPTVVLEVDNQPRDATEDEVKTFRHINDRIPIAAWIVILAGAAERATYFGIIAPWRTLNYHFPDPALCVTRLTTAENYMQNARGSNGTPGALGLGQSM